MNECDHKVFVNIDGQGKTKLDFGSESDEWNHSFPVEYEFKFCPDCGEKNG